MEKKLYELELTRHNITPSRFLAYVRAMCKKHEIFFEMDLSYFKEGEKMGNSGEYWNTHYINGTPETRPAVSEICKSLPYNHQTYIKGFDGNVYNQIVEFEFDDEKTGHGYFYIVEITAEDRKEDETMKETAAPAVLEVPETAAPARPAAVSFPCLVKLVEAENAHNLDLTKEAIKNYDTRLREESTSRRWEQYQKGEISREQAEEYAFIRATKEKEKMLEKRLARLDDCANAGDVQSVSISVEWKRSQTWGYNPTATVTVDTSKGWNRYEGRASGCGYDKQSAAVGDAFNQSAALLKMLCCMKEKALFEGVKPSPFNSHSVDSNAKYIHYGAGYGAIPYYEGGVGVSEFWAIFKLCGLKYITGNSGKHHDYYYFERGV